MRSSAQPVLPGAATIAGVGAAAWLAAHASAPAVRAWSPGGGRHVIVGRLSARILDPPDPAARPGTATVLLHGLMASGDMFGGAYDALADDGPVLVPDLLGFGRSMRTDLDGAGAFQLSAHLDALSSMIAAVLPDGMPVRIGGHSMGGVVAVHLASRLVASRRPVNQVVTWGAPLYRSRATGRQRVARLGGVARLFAFDSPLAEATCAAMCRFRRTAAVLAVAASPRLPTQIARRGVLHTWPSYQQAMDTIVLDPTWPNALQSLTEEGVAVRIAAGTDDPVVDPVTLARARQWPHVRVRMVDGATHELPLTHPRICRAQLRDVPTLRSDREPSDRESSPSTPMSER